VVETFQDPKRFACFLVTNPSNSISVDTALRYWGCATQAGVHVAGALYPFSSPEATAPDAEFGKKFVPLSVAGLPYVAFDSPPNWDEAVGAEQVKLGPFLHLSPLIKQPELLRSSSLVSKNQT
jgi:hypothetical protein